MQPWKWPPFRGGLLAVCGEAAVAQRWGAGALARSSVPKWLRASLRGGEGGGESPARLSAAFTPSPQRSARKRRRGGGRGEERDGRTDARLLDGQSVRVCVHRPDTWTLSGPAEARGLRVRERVETQESSLSPPRHFAWCRQVVGAGLSDFNSCSQSQSEPSTGLRTVCHPLLSLCCQRVSHPSTRTRLRAAL